MIRQRSKQWMLGSMLFLAIMLMSSCTSADVTAWLDAATVGPSVPPALADTVVIEPEMHAYLQAHLQMGRFMGSVLVANQGEVVHSAGYGMADLEHDVPNIPQTKFRIGSLTKQFTAAAILHLQDAGLLSVDDAVSAYLPEFPEGGRLTIENLLAHTSGIPNYTSFPDYLETLREPTTLEALTARFAGQPLLFEPGTQFSYSNSNYVLLTRIIEEVSGQSYSDYLRQNLFDPLGLADTGYDRYEAILEHRAEGYVWTGDVYEHAAFIDTTIPTGAGALYSTALDLHSWVQALDQGAVLSDMAREALFTPVIEIGGGDSYAYGWNVSEIFDQRAIAHSGGVNGFSSHLLYLPEADLIVVTLANVETAPSPSISRDLAAIALGEPYELPEERTAVEVDSTILERYVGRYQFTPNNILQISLAEGQLYGQLNEQPPIPLYAESETDFFLRVVDAEINFQLNDSGEVTGLIFSQAGQEVSAPKVD
jgi:CubicO group peptidase (beta-lactamase class C family)